MYTHVSCRAASWFANGISPRRLSHANGEKLACALYLTNSVVKRMRHRAICPNYVTVPNLFPVPLCVMDNSLFWQSTQRQAGIGGPGLRFSCLHFELITLYWSALYLILSWSSILGCELLCNNSCLSGQSKMAGGWEKSERETSLQSRKASRHR